MSTMDRLTSLPGRFMSRFGSVDIAENPARQGIPAGQTAFTKGSIKDLRTVLRTVLQKNVKKISLAELRQLPLLVLGKNIFSFTHTLGRSLSPFVVTLNNLVPAQDCSPHGCSFSGDV